MSLWFRERRSFPTVTFAQVAHQIVGGSFADVSLTTAESSLQKVAVGAATDLIASLASELPVDVYRGTGRDKVAVSTPSYLDDPAGDGYGRPDWVYQFLMSHLLRGNANGDILALGRSNFPTQIALFHPDSVNGWFDSEGRPKWMAGGREVPSDRMWHRRSYPVPGQLMGMSPIGRHATTVKLGIAATRYGNQFFTDGGHPQGILRNNAVDNVEPQAAQTVKDRFMAAVRGTREPVVLGRQWEWTAIQVKPEESQFLETNKFTAAECCRIYGPGIAELLGYETGGSMTYANVVDRDLHLLKYALGRWLKRVDRALSSMLPRDQWVRLNRDALLETTTYQRYQAHKLALDAQWKVPDEVRDIEDMDPLPDGMGAKPIKTGAGQQPANEPKDGA